MYYYIVDPGKISQRDFERVQNQLYSSVSEYKIAGEIARVTTLRTIPQLVEGALTRGYKTIVAVGGDDTLHDLINAVAGREVGIGFIPIIASEVGQILGLGDIPHSAKTIAIRRIEEMDLIYINHNAIITSVAFGAGMQAYSSIFELWRLPTFQIDFSADNNEFRGTTQAIGGVVINSRLKKPDNQKLFNPTDGILDVLLLPKLSKFQTLKFRIDILKGNFEKIPGSSIIHVRQLQISAPEGLPLRVSNKIITRTPATIEVKPKALKIIVGKERKF